MRTLSAIFASLALVFGALSVSAQETADERTDRTLGDRVDDASITARVKTALISNDETKARQIDVDTMNGVVQLSGFVDSLHAKEAAERTAREVSGVREVHNELIVRERGERTAGAVVDDTVIAAKVKGEIAGDAGLQTAGNVNVEVNRGVVELSGFVSEPEQKTQAERIARAVEGVVDVRNNIELRPRG